MTGSKSPPMRHRSAAVLLISLVLVSGILAAGCLESLSIPNMGSIRFPTFNGTEGNLKVYFLDVGQGDSSLVTFNNRTILIDAGETDMGPRVVNDLHALNVTKIDLLVSTHPHSDHIGGMQDVLSAFPVGQVLDTGMPHPSALYEKFLNTVDRDNIPYKVAEQGQTIDLDPALRILVLSPPAQRFGDDLNQNSVMLRVSYGTVDLLFTGDAGKEAETALLKTGYAVDAEVLKVSHHGSSDATGAAFLSRVAPKTAVISVGAENPYGHPHNETLAALKDAGTEIFRTDHDGTILVTSDGSTYSVRTEKGTGGISSPAPAARQTAAAATPTAPLSTTAPSPVPANVTVPVPSFTIPAIRIGNASSVSIGSTQFNAPGDDRQNLNGEWVQVVNHGGEPVLLAGWTLTDRSGSFVYTFPPFILDPDRTVTVYTGSGWFNDTALFMGQTTPVWGNSGDMAVLKDATGAVVDQRTEGAV